MGRPRKDPSAGLPKRVYLRRGRFFYDHYTHSASPTGKRWENLGTDLAFAKKQAEAYSAGAPMFGTMAHWLNVWRLELDARVRAGTLSERTRADYMEAMVPLSLYFGRMDPTSIGPHHVSDYLDIGRDNDRPIRANREKAALSSCMTWMIKKGHAGLRSNVCLQARRNPEQARDRYISDDEYLAVIEKLRPAEKLWAELMFRTLQRPSDILRWTTKNMVIEGGQKLLRFRQSKTKTNLSIIVSETLAAAISELRSTRAAVTSLYLVPREDGKPYTESGIASMFRRATVAAGIPNFAPYDLKAKGATDMYTAGVPLAQISRLCGHDSVTTTEIYIKRHLAAPVAPNGDVPLAVEP